MANNYRNNEFEIINLLFEESAGKAIDELGRKLTNLLNKVERYLTLTSIDFFTYREMISYVLNNKPINEDIVKAAVVKRFKDNKFNLTIVYLDCNNKPVWKDSDGKLICFAVIANKVDEEIKGVFGNKDIIIIE